MSRNQNGLFQDLPGIHPWVLRENLSLLTGAFLIHLLICQEWRQCRGLLSMEELKKIKVTINVCFLEHLHLSKAPRRFISVLGVSHFFNYVVYVSWCYDWPEQLPQFCKPYKILEWLSCTSVHVNQSTTLTTHFPIQQSTNQPAERPTSVPIFYDRVSLINQSGSSNAARSLHLLTCRFIFRTLLKIESEFARFGAIIDQIYFLLKKD